MKTYQINNRRELAEWFSNIHLMKGDLYPVAIQLLRMDEKPRSLEANALSHVWYREIAKQAGDRTPEEVKRECKLTCGVPILRVESDDFRKMYDKVVKGHDYETKLEVMDYLPLTSLMTKDQMSEYMETVHYKYTNAGYILDHE